MYYILQQKTAQSSIIVSQPIFEQAMNVPTTPLHMMELGYPSSYPHSTQHGCSAAAFDFYGEQGRLFEKGTLTLVNMSHDM